MRLLKRRRALKSDAPTGLLILFRPQALRLGVPGLAVHQPTILRGGGKHPRPPAGEASSE